jgi:hypothetical protein
MINLWKKFNNLLPQDPLLIATVAAHNSDGTSTVTWPGGGQSTVQGQSVAVGSKAFVQSNRLQGQAPDLPSYEFEV